MFYILDSSGYIEEVSTHYIERENKTCAEYTGAVPSGYDTLDDWVLNANVRAYKISSGNLVYDADRDAALTAQWAQTDGYGAVLGKASKNLLDPFNKYAATSASYDYSNNTYKLTSSGAIYLMCRVVVGNTYTLSYKNNNGFASIRANDYNNGSWIEYGRSTTTNGAITFKANTDTVVIQFVGGTANSSTVQDVQLEQSLTATEYEKYQAPYVVAIDSDGGCHKIGDNYSLGEQVIGTWIDGKPLYRKTYQGTFNGKNDLYIAHGLSNYKAVNVYGVSISNTTNNTIPLNVVRPLAASYEIGFYVTSTDIVVETSKSVDRTGTIVYATIEYIKTTD